MSKSRHNEFQTVKLVHGEDFHFNNLCWLNFYNFLIVFCFAFSNFWLNHKALKSGSKIQFEIYICLRLFIENMGSSI